MEVKEAAMDCVFCCDDPEVLDCIRRDRDIIIGKGLREEVGRGGGNNRWMQAYQQRISLLIHSIVFPARFVGFVLQ